KKIPPLCDRAHRRTSREDLGAGRQGRRRAGRVGRRRRIRPELPRAADEGAAIETGFFSSSFLSLSFPSSLSSFDASHAKNENELSTATNKKTQGKRKSTPRIRLVEADIRERFRRRGEPGRPQSVGRRAPLPRKVRIIKKTKQNLIKTDKKRTNERTNRKT